MKKIIEILEAYGFSVEFTDQDQCRTRFQSEETFIDVWEGRKGITVGLYSPKTKMVKYHRRVSHEEVEKLIVKNS